MKPRNVSLYAFCSVKGGVGKSTLAVASAAFLSRRGTCALLDADLSGTSLADGLRLCAPALPFGEEGFLDLCSAAPVPLLHHSRESTLQFRAERKLRRMSTATYIPFLNDVLNLAASTISAPASMEMLAWRHEDDADKRGPLFFPSSSLRSDMAAALDWLYQAQPNLWLCRFTWVLLNLIQRIPNLDAIIIDLPPGTFGFTHEVIQMLASLSQGLSLPEGYPDFTAAGIAWHAKPLLVLSEDVNDLCAGMEYLADFQPHVPALRPIVNRSGSSLAELRTLVKQHLDRFQGGFRQERLIKNQVPFVPSLSTLFRSGDLPSGADFLERVLREEMP